MTEREQRIEEAAKHLGIRLTGCEAVIAIHEMASFAEQQVRAERERTAVYREICEAAEEFYWPFGTAAQNGDGTYTAKRWLTRGFMTGKWGADTKFPTLEAAYQWVKEGGNDEREGS